MPTWAEKMMFMVGMYCAEASDEPRKHSTRERGALSRCPAAWGCRRLSRHSALDSAADQQGGWVLVAPCWACCAARRCSCPQTWWARGMRATAGWLLPGVMPGDKYSAWLQVELTCYEKQDAAEWGWKQEWAQHSGMKAAQQGTGEWHWWMDCSRHAGKMERSSEKQTGSAPASVVHRKDSCLIGLVQEEEAIQKEDELLHQLSSTQSLLGRCCLQLGPQASMALQQHH